MIQDKTILLKYDGEGHGFIRLLFFDEEIGLTLVDREDPEFYRACFIGPKSPKFFDSQQAKDNPELWTSIMTDVLEHVGDTIEEGYIDFDEIDQIVNSYFDKPEDISSGGMPSSLTCPFNV